MQTHKLGFETSHKDEMQKNGDKYCFFMFVFPYQVAKRQSQKEFTKTKWFSFFGTLFVFVRKQYHSKAYQ